MTNDGEESHPQLRGCLCLPFFRRGQRRQPVASLSQPAEVLSGFTGSGNATRNVYAPTSLETLPVVRIESPESSSSGAAVQTINDASTFEGKIPADTSLTACLSATDERGSQSSAQLCSTLASEQCSQLPAPTGVSPQIAPSQRETRSSTMLRGLARGVDATHLLRTGPASAPIHPNTKAPHANVRKVINSITTGVDGVSPGSSLEAAPDAPQSLPSYDDASQHGLRNPTAVSLSSLTMGRSITGLTSSTYPVPHHLPLVHTVTTAPNSAARPLHHPSSMPACGNDVLSSILSEPAQPIASSFAQSGELSRFQSLQGALSSVLNADTGHVSNVAVEQLRQQLLCDQASGVVGRPIDVDNVEKVGQGSYGVVYRGVWQGANVAIKYLCSSSTQQLQISTTEALLSQLLAHPNVVQTFACKVVELTTDYFSTTADQHARGDLPAILQLSPLTTELGDPAGTSLAPGAGNGPNRHAEDASGACDGPGASLSTARHSGFGGTSGALVSRLAGGGRTGSNRSTHSGLLPAGGPMGHSDLHVSAASGMTIALSPALAHLASHGTAAGSPKVGGGDGDGGGGSALVHAHAHAHGSGAGAREVGVPSGGGAAGAVAAAAGSGSSAVAGSATIEVDALATEDQQPPILHPAAASADAQASARSALQSNAPDRGRSCSEGPTGPTRLQARSKSHSPDSAHGGYLSPLHRARTEIPQRRAATYDGHVSRAHMAAAPAFRRVTWATYAAQEYAEGDPAEARVQTQGSGGPRRETPALPAPTLVSPWHTPTATAAATGGDVTAAAANASGGGGGGGGGSDPFVYGSGSTTARPPSHVHGHVHGPSPLGAGAAAAAASGSSHAMHHHLLNHHHHHGTAHAAHAAHSSRQFTGQHGDGGGGGGAAGGRGVPLFHALLQARGREADEVACAEALDSFQSGDGFGAPYLDDAEQPSLAKYRPLLEQLHAKPGDFLTQIIMEHCDRGSLQRAIDRNIFRASSRWNARVALRAMLRTAREIAQGMCHLHASQIVHGDLKPQNVLLKSSRSDRRGFIAKVADFGLSKILQAKERSTLDCDTDATGTVPYMAPEVLDGSMCPAADAYSFGVILWQLVTGERPFADVHPGRMWVGVCAGTLRLEWPPETHPMVRKLGEACMSFDKRQRPPFTKIARVLGVIENVVRNEGPNAGGAAASGPGTPGLASGSFAPGSRVAMASTAASMAAAMGASTSGPGGVGGGVGSATLRLSAVIGMYGPGSASVGPSGVGSAVMHGSPLGPGGPPGSYDGMPSLGPNGGAGGSLGCGGATGNGALFGEGAVFAAGQAGAAANGSASTPWAVVQGRSSIPGHSTGPWTGGAGGMLAPAHYPLALITSPSCSSLQGVPSESSLGVMTPLFGRVGSLQGHAHVSMAGAGPAAGPRAQGPLSAQPRAHRRSSGYGGSMPSMPVLAEAAPEAAAAAAAPPASAALVALAMAGASVAGSNDSGRELFSGTAAAVATAAPPPLAAIGRASTMPRASAPRMSAYGGVEFPVQQSAGPLSGRTITSSRASAPTVPLPGPAHSSAAMSYGSGGGGSTSAMRPTGVYEMLGTSDGHDPRMHNGSPSMDANPFRSFNGMAPSSLRPSPPRPPLPQQQQQQRANGGQVSSAASPFLVAGPIPMPPWRETVPNPRFVMRPPEGTDHLRLIQGALVQALPEYAARRDAAGGQDGPAVAAAHMVYPTTGHLLPGSTLGADVGVLGSVAGMYGASAPPPPPQRPLAPEQQQQLLLLCNRIRPMLHTLALTGQQQQCLQPAPMAAAGGGGAGGPEGYLFGTGAGGEGVQPAVMAASGPASGSRRSSVAGVDRAASPAVAPPPTSAGSPARRVSFQPGVQQQQLCLQMQQQQQLCFQMQQQQQQHLQQGVLDPFWQRYNTGGVAVSPVFPPPAALDTTALYPTGTSPLFQTPSGINGSHPGPGAVYDTPAAAAAAAAAASAGAGRCPGSSTVGAGPAPISADWCADRPRPMGHVGSQSPDPTRHASDPRLVSLGAGTAGAFLGAPAVQQQAAVGMWACTSVGAPTDGGGVLGGMGNEATGTGSDGAAGDGSTMLDDSVCASGVSILFPRQTHLSSSAADAFSHAAGSVGSYSVQHGTAMGQLLALAHLPDGLANGAPMGPHPGTVGGVPAGHVAQGPGLVSGYQLMYGMGMGVNMGGQLQGNMGMGLGSGASPPQAQPLHAQPQPQARSLGCVSVSRDGLGGSGVPQVACQPGSPLSYRERERDRVPAGLRRDTILEGDEDAEGA